MQLTEIIGRLKGIRKNLGLSQAVFASKIGLAQGSYCMIETGKDALSDRNIMLICRTFNISEDYLRYGRGDMFNPPSTAQNEEEAHLLALFRKLSKEMKRLVLKKIEQILALDGNWNEPTSDNTKSTPTQTEAPFLGHTSETSPQKIA